MNEQSSIKRPRAGRPTREQAQARQEYLLDRAIEHFLDKGFEKTTVEAIAADVNMTKRTVYGRYEDKTALFREALKRAVLKHAATPERIEATRGKDLEQTLVNLAMQRIEQVEKPFGLKLQRLINTESYRFPDILTMAYDASTRPAIEFLEAVLEEETQAGNVAVPDLERAAVTFLSMVVSGPITMMISGNPLTAAEIEKRVVFAVRLFLDGARRR